MSNYYNMMRACATNSERRMQMLAARTAVTISDEAWERNMKLARSFTEGMRAIKAREHMWTSANERGSRTNAVAYGEPRHSSSRTNAVAYGRK